MIALKCKMCGGTLNTDKKSTVAVCEFCGTKQTLPQSGVETTVNLYNRANNLRLKYEFDKASALYEKIVEQDDSDAEAHWGIVLCKYGVEYVEDPKTQKRIPTCHRTCYDSILKDIDYQAAIDYSDADQQSIYENEAHAIDKIQKGILNIVQNEKPFDVFICYKEKDENGKRTVDSTLANDIYYNLTDEGFKVFYAAITLEDKLGQEYEPYIFAALTSAKVMLVVGTKQEYFRAVWVKNEWSRFMNLMKTDRSKTLIPCYRDMDPYDLPEEFAHLQAQDMGKIGFINDVVRGISKIIKKERPEEDKKSIQKISTEPCVEVLLKRIELFLEDGDSDKADEFCEKVLNIEPENAKVYFYKLLMEFNCSTKEDLFDLITKMSRETALSYGCNTKDEIIARGIPIFSSKNYNKIVRFAKKKDDSDIIDDIENAIDLSWTKLSDDDINKVQIDDIEFVDYSCPNCGEIVSYPKALCKKGALLKCTFCDNDFIESSKYIVNAREVIKNNLNDHITAYLQNEELDELSVDKICPISDINSPLIKTISVAPQEAYIKAESRKIKMYTPYVYIGDIVAIFTNNFEAYRYLGIKPKNDEEISNYFSFVLENEDGRIWVCDLASADVDYYYEKIEAGEIGLDDWCDKFIHQFGGYSVDEYPEKGEKVAVLGLYIGFSQKYNIATCSLGINKMYYDWCLNS